MVDKSKEESLHQALLDNQLVQENSYQSQEDEGQVLKIEGYTQPTHLSIIFFLSSILSLGILFVLSKWYLSIEMFFRYRRSKLSNARHVYVHTKYYHTMLSTFYLPYRSSELLAFKHQEIVYIFDSNKFAPVEFEPNITKAGIVEEYGKGYSSSERVSELNTMYGPCQISVEIQPISHMILTAMFTPFFFFQVFSFSLWYWELYYFFATFIIVLTVASITYSIYQTRTSMKALDKLARRERTVVVHRGSVKVINSYELIPGDLIEIPLEGEVPCDIVLISGTCTLNEGMLTGECLPVVKDCIDRSNSLYSVDHDKKNTLYEGTKILQVRSYGAGQVLGIVMRTGFNTMKGKVIRSMLYPKPSEFKFYEDSVKFILLLFCLAIIGFAVSMYQMIQLKLATIDIATKCFDLITITVPPSLPATMTVGTAFAIKRLSNHKILCIDSNRINVAGKIDLVCFDKTGTLTEDGVTMLGVQGKHKSVMQREMCHPKDMKKNKKFHRCMASCHSLTLMDGKLIGDPQELEIFNSLSWKFSESQEDGRPCVTSPAESLKILRAFHFTSKLKRMGVISQNTVSGKLEFFAKGAPEILIEKCFPDSVPEELHYMLASYTNKGYRVLACASKELDVIGNDLQSITLESIESDCRFIGLIILQNTLKPESLPAIEILKKARIRTVMSTGDALLTAICVARECHILQNDITVYLGESSERKPYWEEISYPENLNRDIKHMILEIPPWQSSGISQDYVFAMSGASFMHLVIRAESGNVNDIENLNFCLDHCNVFARMSPEHKTLLVQMLHSRGSLVAMCGDGTNDCGALRSADIGISLSEADSSIAAPFTSKINNISSVVTVLKEGRCALSTSVQCFKYMCLYSMIQSTTVTILYWFGMNLSNGQYLTFDLFTVMPLAVFMAYTLPYHKLSVTSPAASLVTLPVIISIAGHYILQLSTQILAYYLLSIQEFVDSMNAEGFAKQGPFYSWEDTVIFYVSWVMYQIVCVAISTGKPYKKPGYTNYLLTAVHLIIFATILYIFINPSSWFRELLSVMII